MAAFDFVVDKDLRISLDSDWSELLAAFENSAWKAVHVLAGSIIEAILIDHLLSINYADKDPLKMTLDEVIAACKNRGILSDTTAELSTVIRRYRNLIHPGRSVRLSEIPDSHGANVCKSLVLIISREIAKAKRQSYGYTAEQIAFKLERDTSALAILSHLLKKTNERELGRLLLEVLPERYIELTKEPFSDCNWIEKCFQTPFDASSAATKERVAKQFIKVLHEGDGSVVRMYEEVFFRVAQLDYMTPDEIRAVIQHIAAQLRQDPSNSLFAACMGIGKYLQEDDIQAYVDTAIRLIADGKRVHSHNVCQQFLVDLYMKLPSGPDEKLKNRVVDWVKFLKDHNRSEDAERVDSLSSDWVPF
jgi:hypothetical protein